VVLLRVTTVNLTPVDVKDMNKNDVNSASSHTCICFLFSVEAHSSQLSSSHARSLLNNISNLPLCGVLRISAQMDSSSKSDVEDTEEV